MRRRGGEERSLIRVPTTETGRLFILHLSTSLPVTSSRAQTVAGRQKMVAGSGGRVVAGHDILVGGDGRGTECLRNWWQ